MVALGQEQVPQSRGFRLRLELRHHRQLVPTIGGGIELPREYRLGRIDVRLHEFRDALGQLRGAWRHGRQHCCLLQAAAISPPTRASSARWWSASPNSVSMMLTRLK